MLRHAGTGASIVGNALYADQYQTDQNFQAGPGGAAYVFTSTKAPANYTVASSYTNKT